MPILKIPVEAADELLNTSMFGAGALGRVERSATGGGAGYSEIGTFALVATTKLYTFYDLSGADTSWYRVRYSTSAGASPSAYGDEFQAGPTGGLICELYDVIQLTGTLSDSDTEAALELIRQVTTEIEGATGRDFTGDRLDTSYLFDIERTSRILRIPKGVQSVTTLEIATSSQPESGGTYTTVTAADVFLRPTVGEREPGWPATRIVLSDRSGSYFHPGYNTVRALMKGGFAAVPPDIQRVGAEMVRDGFMGKGTPGERAVVGPSGQPILLRDPHHRAIIERYKVLVAPG